MNLDDNLRTELRAVHVPYDGFTADHMIDRAVSTPGRGPVRLGAPLATAAAVLAVAGGTAFALAGGGHGDTTPAGAGASQQAAYTTHANPGPQSAPLPADLQSRIQQCIQNDGTENWGTEHDNCGDVISICQIADALDTDPCTLIPAAVIANAPVYKPSTAAPGADVPAKSPAPTH